MVKPRAPPPAGAAGRRIARPPRPWERPGTIFSAGYPAGARTSAVTSPAPGATITSTTPITLTFSKPYASVLGGHMPSLSSNPTGHWTSLDTHTLVFKPSGYGYGLGATVGVGLPSGVQVVGGHPAWTVPTGASLRVNEILAQLGYLPLSWAPTSAQIAPTPAA